MASDTAGVARASGEAEQARSKWSVAAGAVASAIGNLAANAIANLIAGLGQAVTRIFEFGGELTDLSNKTGLSTSTLQALKYAGDQTGVSLETITKSVSKLGINLAGGKDSAVGALNALGLSFDDLRKMSPEQQFYTVAEAMGLYGWLPGESSMLFSHNVSASRDHESGSELCTRTNGFPSGISRQPSPSRSL